MKLVDFVVYRKTDNLNIIGNGKNTVGCFGFPSLFFFFIFLMFYNHKLKCSKHLLFCIQRSCFELRQNYFSAMISKCTILFSNKKTLSIYLFFNTTFTLLLHYYKLILLFNLDFHKYFH